MSQYLPLSTKSVQFILTLFDAGATMHQILDAFYASGQMGVQYVTIQRCLREHGRSMYPLLAQQYTFIANKDY